jgi:hypothetical protein
MRHFLIMNNGKMKKKTRVFPNHLANLMWDIISLFGDKLVVFGGYIWSGCFHGCFQNVFQMCVRVECCLLYSCSLWRMFVHICVRFQKCWMFSVQLRKIFVLFTVQTLVEVVSRLTQLLAPIAGSHGPVSSQPQCTHHFLDAPSPLGTEVDRLDHRSHPSGAVVRNAWSFASTPVAVQADCGSSSRACGWNYFCRAGRGAVTSGPAASRAP